MSTPNDVTDSDLHGFVDGQLDPETRARVEEWLTQNPEDAARVREWQSQKDLLHEAFDDVLEEPMPPAMEARLSGATGDDGPDDGPDGGRAYNIGARAWMRAAAAVLVFVAGIGVGWMIRGQTVPADGAQFVRQAISAHVVYVKERRHAVEVWAKEERHLVAWLSNKLKHRIKAPDLTGVGFRLVGGRLVADEGSPAAQFMFEDTTGRRVTLYTRRDREGAETSFRFVGRGDVSAFYWIGKPLAFALIGDMKREELLSLSRIVFKSFEP